MCIICVLRVKVSTKCSCHQSCHTSFEHLITNGASSSTHAALIANIPIVFDFYQVLAICMVLEKTMGSVCTGCENGAINS